MFKKIYNYLLSFNIIKNINIYILFIFNYIIATNSYYLYPIYKKYLLPLFIKKNEIIYIKNGMDFEK